MSISLARKYRPRKFADVAVQSHVSTTLQGAIAKGRVAHGYLFCGPRGTGKTTLARQWLQQEGGTALAVGLAGGDVAVVARSLARALSAAVPELPRGVEEAIRAAPTPARQAQSVARAILAVVEGALETWLVVDELNHKSAPPRG